MPCRLLTIVRNPPEGVHEVRGDGLDGGRVMDTRLVVPGEFETPRLDRPYDFDQVRSLIGRVVVLTEEAAYGRIEVTVGLGGPGIPRAEIVERPLRACRVHL